MIRSVWARYRYPCLSGETQDAGGDSECERSLYAIIELIKNSPISGGIFCDIRVSILVFTVTLDIIRALYLHLSYYESAIISIDFLSILNSSELRSRISNYVYRSI